MLSMGRSWNRGKKHGPTRGREVGKRGRGNRGRQYDRGGHRNDQTGAYRNDQNRNYTTNKRPRFDDVRYDEQYDDEQYIYDERDHPTEYGYDYDHDFINEDRNLDEHHPYYDNERDIYDERRPPSPERDHRRYFDNRQHEQFDEKEERRPPSPEGDHRRYYDNRQCEQFDDKEERRPPSPERDRRRYYDNRQREQFDEKEFYPDMSPTYGDRHDNYDRPLEPPLDWRDGDSEQRDHVEQPFESYRDRKERNDHRDRFRKGDHRRNDHRNDYNETQGSENLRQGRGHSQEREYRSQDREHHSQDREYRSQDREHCSQDRGHYGQYRRNYSQERGQSSQERERFWENENDYYKQENRDNYTEVQGYDDSYINKQEDDFYQDNSNIDKLGEENQHRDRYDKRYPPHERSRERSGRYKHRDNETDRIRQREDNRKSQSSKSSKNESTGNRNRSHNKRLSRDNQHGYADRSHSPRPSKREANRKNYPGNSNKDNRSTEQKMPPIVNENVELVPPRDMNPPEFIPPSTNLVPGEKPGEVLVLVDPDTGIAMPLTTDGPPVMNIMPVIPTMNDNAVNVPVQNLPGFLPELPEPASQTFQNRQQNLNVRGRGKQRGRLNQRGRGNNNSRLFKNKIVSNLRNKAMSYKNQPNKMRGNHTNTGRNNFNKTLGNMNRNQTNLNNKVNNLGDDIKMQRKRPFNSNEDNVEKPLSKLPRNHETQDLFVTLIEKRRKDLAVSKRPEEFNSPALNEDLRETRIGYGEWNQGRTVDEIPIDYSLDRQEDYIPSVGDRFQQSDRIVEIGHKQDMSLRNRLGPQSNEHQSELSSQRKEMQKDSYSRHPSELSSHRNERDEMQKDNYDKYPSELSSHRDKMQKDNYGRHASELSSHRNERDEMWKDNYDKYPSELSSHRDKLQKDNYGRHASELSSHRNERDEMWKDNYDKYPSELSSHRNERDEIRKDNYDKYPSELSSHRDKLQKDNYDRRPSELSSHRDEMQKDNYNRRPSELSSHRDEMQKDNYDRRPSELSSHRDEMQKDNYNRRPSELSSHRDEMQKDNYDRRPSELSSHRDEMQKDNYDRRPSDELHKDNYDRHPSELSFRRDEMQKDNYNRHPSELSSHRDEMQKSHYSRQAFELSSHRDEMQNISPSPHGRGHVKDRLGPILKDVTYDKSKPSFNEKITVANRPVIVPGYQDNRPIGGSRTIQSHDERMHVKDRLGPRYKEHPGFVKEGLQSPGRMDKTVSDISTRPIDFPSSKDKITADTSKGMPSNKERGFVKDRLGSRYVDSVNANNDPSVSKYEKDLMKKQHKESRWSPADFKSSQDRKVEVYQTGDKPVSPKRNSFDRDIQVRGMELENKNRQQSPFDTSNIARTKEMLENKYKDQGHRTSEIRGKQSGNIVKDHVRSVTVINKSQDVPHRRANSLEPDHGRIDRIDLTKQRISPSRLDLHREKEHFTMSVNKPSTETSPYRSKEGKKSDYISLKQSTESKKQPVLPTSSGFSSKEEHQKQLEISNRKQKGAERKSVDVISAQKNQIKNLSSLLEVLQNKIVEDESKRKKEEAEKRKKEEQKKQQQKLEEAMDLDPHVKKLESATSHHQHYSKQLDKKETQPPKSSVQSVMRSIDPSIAPLLDKMKPRMSNSGAPIPSLLDGMDHLSKMTVEEKAKLAATLPRLAEVADPNKMSLADKIRLLRFIMDTKSDKDNAIQIIEESVQGCGLGLTLKYEAKEITHVKGKLTYTGSLYLSDAFLARSVGFSKKEIKHSVYEQALNLLRKKTAAEIVDLRDPGVDELRRELIVNIVEEKQKERADDNSKESRFRKLAQFIRDCKNPSVCCIAFFQQAVEFSGCNLPYHYEPKKISLPLGESIFFHKGTLAIDEIVVGIGTGHKGKSVKSKTFENAIDALKSRSIKDVLKGIRPVENVENSSPVLVDKDRFKIPLKNRLLKMVEVMKESAETKDYETVMDQAAKENWLTPACVYKKPENSKVGKWYICEYFINHLLVGEGEGESINLAENDAYRNAWRSLMKTKVHQIIDKNKRMKHTDFSNPNIIDVCLKVNFVSLANTSDCNLAALKRLKFDLNQEGKTKDGLVILEHEEWSADRQGQAFSILNHSATQNGMFLHWLIQSDGELFKCAFNLQGECVGEAHGPDKNTAKNLAAADALFRLYDTHDVIKITRWDDSKLWIQYWEIVAQAMKLAHDESGGKDIVKEKGGPDLKWIIQVCQQIIDDYMKKYSLEELVFGPGMPLMERSEVQKLAKKMDLKHDMRQQDGNAYLVLSKKMTPQEMAACLHQNGGISGKYSLVPVTQLPKTSSIEQEIKKYKQPGYDKLLDDASQANKEKQKLEGKINKTNNSTQTKTITTTTNTVTTVSGTSSETQRSRLSSTTAQTGKNSNIASIVPPITVTIPSLSTGGPARSITSSQTNPLQHQSITASQTNPLQPQFTRYSTPLMSVQPSYQQITQQSSLLQQIPGTQPVGVSAPISTVSYSVPIAGPSYSAPISTIQSYVAPVSQRPTYTVPTSTIPSYVVQQNLVGGKFVFGSSQPPSGLQQSYIQSQPGYSAVQNPVTTTVSVVQGTVQNMPQRNIQPQVALSNVNATQNIQASYIQGLQQGTIQPVHVVGTPQNSQILTQNVNTSFPPYQRLQPVQPVQPVQPSHQTPIQQQSHVSQQNLQVPSQIAIPNVLTVPSANLASMSTPNIAVPQPNFQRPPPIVGTQIAQSSVPARATLQPSSQNSVSYASRVHNQALYSKAVSSPVTTVVTTSKQTQSYYPSSKSSTLLSGRSGTTVKSQIHSSMTTQGAKEILGTTRSTNNSPAVVSVASSTPQAEVEQSSTQNNIQQLVERALKVFGGAPELEGALNSIKEITDEKSTSSATAISSGGILDSIIKQRGKEAKSISLTTTQQRDARNEKVAQTNPSEKTINIQGTKSKETKYNTQADRANAKFKQSILGVSGMLTHMRKKQEKEHATAYEKFRETVVNPAEKDKSSSEKPLQDSQRKNSVETQPYFGISKQQTKDESDTFPVYQESSVHPNPYKRKGILKSYMPDTEKSEHDSPKRVEVFPEGKGRNELNSQVNEPKPVLKSILKNKKSSDTSLYKPDDFTNIHERQYSVPSQIEPQMQQFNRSDPRLHAASRTGKMFQKTSLDSGASQTETSKQGNFGADSFVQPKSTNSYPSLKPGIESSYSSLKSGIESYQTRKFDPDSDTSPRQKNTGSYQSVQKDYDKQPIESHPKSLTSYSQPFENYRNNKKEMGDERFNAYDFDALSQENFNKKSQEREKQGFGNQSNMGENQSSMGPIDKSPEKSDFWANYSSKGSANNQNQINNREKTTEAHHSLTLSETLNRLRENYQDDSEQQSNLDRSAPPATRVGIQNTHFGNRQISDMTQHNTMGIESGFGREYGLPRFSYRRPSNSWASSLPSYMDSLASYTAESRAERKEKQF